MRQNSVPVVLASWLYILCHEHFRHNVEVDYPHPSSGALLVLSGGIIFLVSSLDALRAVALVE